MGRMTDRFIKVPKAILKELTNCHRSGRVLGVYCAAFGNDMLTTAVEDIYQAGKDQMMVVFKWYDKNSHLLSSTHVALEEITAIRPINRTMQAALRS
ncbi:MAG TPA: hypothetical protein VD927_17420 [Chryseosolibacter sp.]|nr:hypothetical protein [Chryseosolibacter sp.]